MVVVVQVVGGELKEAVRTNNGTDRTEVTTTATTVVVHRRQESRVQERTSSSAVAAVPMTTICRCGKKAICAGEWVMVKGGGNTCTELRRNMEMRWMVVHFAVQLQWWTRDRKGGDMQGRPEQKKTFVRVI